MRKIREVLRLRLDRKASVREIASSCGIGRSTVDEYVHRAEAAGLCWPLSEDLTDEQLTKLLFAGRPKSGEPGRAAPVWSYVQRRLSRKGMAPRFRDILGNVSARGVLMILSGPSGVGKDTVINEWHKRDPRVERVVAYTTREPRFGEVDGIDYHFVSRDEFKRLADSGHFLESKQVHDNFYATPLKDMQDLLAQGKIAVLKIDVQGAQAVLKLMPDTLDVFLLPPAWSDLKERIISRGLNTEEDIEKRLQNARLEIARSREYRRRIVNQRVEDVVDQLEALVAAVPA